MTHPWFEKFPDGRVEFDGQQAWFCPDPTVLPGDADAVPVGGTLLEALNVAQPQ